MKRILTGAQMRAADNYTIEHIGIPSMVLMERASMQVAETIMGHVTKKQTILVVCGSGNNGGDGYAIARLFHVKGYQVSIWFVGNDSSRSQENQAQKKICDYYGIPEVQGLNKAYDVIVDAIF